ncbi:MAG: acyl-CoA thioesterase [Leptospiraceae bacterium]|nr:acyl-CoA thioesterase [Leptospiraceae bacterium]MCB1319969.1 acyl-CoA thioesterase [Leptospiraceae bacterium]
MPQVPRYSFEIDVNVAWGDMDALGHVNNVTYARYFETVRAEFFLNLKRRHNFEMPADRAMFMTSLHINYRRQLVFPARLTLTLGIVEVHARSLVLGCSMWDGEGQCVADGESHHIWIDLQRTRPTRMPPDFQRVAQELMFQEDD